MPSLVGMTLGAYQVIEPIGRGGMATVYKAYDPATDRHVAIKVLSEEFAQNPGFLARFEREAKVVASLQHVHILPVFEYGQKAGITYLVMPYISTGTLKDYLQQERPTLSEAVRIFCQIGEAVDYAHRRGVLHRDLKPGNVLLDSSKNALLSDFGLTRLAQSTSTLTGTGVIGTPAYISPEQGQGAEVDARSDIYSLGVMLYEMLTGEVPFVADTPVAVILKQINDPLPSPRLKAANLPESIEQVIIQATAKAPAERFQTAGEMVLALRRAASMPFASTLLDDLSIPAVSTPATETIPERPAPLTIRAYLPRRNTRTLSLGLGAVVLGLVGAIILALSGAFGGGDEKTSPPAVVVEDQTPTLTPAPPSPTAPVILTPALQAMRNLPALQHPGSQYPEVGSVVAGQQLDIVGISEDGAWYQVRLPDGIVGWVSASPAMVSVVGNLGEIPVVMVMTDTPSPTATATPLPTQTATLLPTATQTPIPTETATPVPSATQTPAPTETATPVPSATQTPVPTKTATPVPSATQTPVPTETATPVPSATQTPLPTETVTPVPTATQTPLPTETATSVPTVTPLPSATATYTPTVTATATPTITPTATPPASPTPKPPLPAVELAADYQELAVLEGHTGNAIFSVAYSPDGTLFASASKDQTAWLWDAATVKPLTALSGHLGTVFAAAFSPDGQRLATAGADGTVRLWNISTGLQLLVLPKHVERGIFRVAFSPDGTLIAASSQAGTIGLWDAQTGELLKAWTGHQGTVYDVEFSPSSLVLATSGSVDRVVRLWNVDRSSPQFGLMTTALTSSLQGLYEIAYSPDGATLAVGGFPPDIELWNVAAGSPTYGQVRTYLTGHKGSTVTALAYSPDGTVLASGGDDSSVFLWDMRTATQITRLRALSSVVQSVAFAPDGQRLIFGNDDGSLRVWGVP